MTIDRLHLAELIEKGSDADLLREMMTFVVNRMMDLDVESLTGAGYGERTVECQRRSESPLKSPV